MSNHDTTLAKNNIATYRTAAGRDVAALLNPRPVVLIGAHDQDETDFATIAWVTPVSHTPALIAFALREKSRTLQLARNAGVFCLSVLDASDTSSRELATYCGNTSGHRENKATQVPHTLTAAPSCDGDGDTNECVPTVTGALSWLTCTINDVRETGDHMLVIARVVDAKTRCPQDNQGRIACSQALLCVQHDVFTEAAEF